jgi:cell division transport system ATP-binding protein
MIYFENVSKRFRGGQDGLLNLSFQVEHGEMAFITGHSGAGKSTLLRIVGLLEHPTSGQVNVGGYDLAGISRRQVPFYRRKVGMVFQDHRLLLNRTVFDNVAMPLVVSGVNHAEVGRRTRAALDKVGLLSRERYQPAVLSAGEQQRVGIARAIVARPPLLLADEPTGNLDPALSLEIMHLFEEFNRVGVTLLVATHDRDMITTMNKRVLTLREGELVADSARSTVSASPDDVPASEGDDHGRG